MILITGGLYQGKRDYARERFGLTEADEFVCEEDTRIIDFKKRCVVDIEQFTLAAARLGVEPALYFAASKPLWEKSDKILIITDISCGVVPTDPVERRWREANSYLAGYLARSADEVVRMFMGIPKVLKK